ncbi:hypothetical protein [Microbispora sp. NBC_01389]|uniref:hypothetical protein n=1 Tax=Microbispora sp. NBC_01389 TaxID=2903584 RepID=UPI0032434A91
MAQLPGPRPPGERDSYLVAEQVLCDRLAGALGPGMLNLADRNFFSMARRIAFSATGAQLIWRVKNGKKSVPGKIMRRLGDGSYLVRLRESDGMVYRRRRQHGDLRLPRLPDTTARLVEFDLVAEERSGKTSTSRLRLLTTLLDIEVAPADQIAAGYAERWQAEPAYYQLKCSLRGTALWPQLFPARGCSSPTGVEELIQVFESLEEG